jgi:hypothetical protein
MLGSLSLSPIIVEANLKQGAAIPIRDVYFKGNYGCGINSPYSYVIGLL